MIPPEKSAVVSRALREAFETTDIDEIRKITKGLGSDLLFRIVVRGAPYVLRVLTRMGEFNDPVRVFGSMNAAAGAGLTPPVRYASAEDGVAITDFVEAVRLPVTQAADQLPGMLRRLHGLPPFPKIFNYVTAHNGFIWKFRKAGLLPEGELEEVFRAYDRICAAYPRLDADLVSCHMDLKPENIVFDGQSMWLEGWQAAFRNDRYFDLAVAANFLVPSDAEEPGHLERYFGRPADDYQSSRFFLMRQVVHMLSATVFLTLGAAGKPICRSENLPSFRDFHERIWEGGVDLANNDRKVDYGMVHWEQLLRNLRQPRFEQALRAVERKTTEEGAQLLLPSAP